MRGGWKQLPGFIRSHSLCICKVASQMPSKETVYLHGIHGRGANFSLFLAFLLNGLRRALLVVMLQRSACCI